MLCYHTKRLKAAMKLSTQKASFYYVFSFVIFWMLSRIAYFTDAFVNYGFETEALLTILPVIFTYITILIIVGNLIQLCNIIENKQDNVEYIKMIKVLFYLVAAFCIGTQIVDIIVCVTEPPVYVGGY